MKIAPGNRIKLARLKAGMTQAQLAKVLNVTQGTVGSWEVGIAFPRPRNLVKLSEVLKIPVSELLRKAG